MPPILSRALLLVACLALGACAGRPLPKYQKPVARAGIQQIRTTAYTHSEADHIKHGARTALGTRLRNGPVHSAAADWSRWPAGTLFRIAETGELFEVDDYGWALAGTNTIDLYKPSRAAMNHWGVRTVTIELLRWGRVWDSYAVLKPRSKHAHIKRMIRQIDQRYPRGREGVMPLAPAAFAAVAPAPVPAPTVRRAEPVTVVRAVPATPTGGSRRASSSQGGFRASAYR